MKNIQDLLKDAGLTLPEDKTEAFNKEFLENYRTIADYDKQKETAELTQDNLFY